MVSQAQIERRLRALEKIQRAQSSRPTMPQFFFVKTDMEDVLGVERDALIKCQTMRPPRYPVLIRFLGLGGDELGTGPFTEDRIDLRGETSLE